MDSFLKLDLHKTLFGTLGSFKSDTYSLKSVELAVADFSAVMGIGAVLSSSSKPLDLFSKEEKIVSLFEFRPCVVGEEAHVPEAHVDHTTIDMHVGHAVNSTNEQANNNNGVQENEEEEEEEEKRYSQLVDAAMAEFFPNGVEASRRKYTPAEIRQLIEMHFVKGQSVTEVLKTSSIKDGTARGFIRQVRHIFENTQKTVANDPHRALISIQRIDEMPSLPRSAVKPVPRGNQKLYKEHTRFLVDFFARNQCATLDMAREALLKSFDLGMSRSGIHQHMEKRSICFFILKFR